MNFYDIYFLNKDWFSTADDIYDRVVKTQQELKNGTCNL